MAGSIIIRVGLAIVFAYFAVMQFIDPSSWIGYLPRALQTTANPLLLIYANAALDMVLALTIGLAVFPRVAPLVGAAHLLGIAFFMGLNEVAVRDFGLAMACLGLAFIREEHITGYQRRFLGRFFKH